MCVCIATKPALYTWLLRNSAGQNRGIHTYMYIFIYVHMYICVYVLLLSQPHTISTHLAIEKFCRAKQTRCHYSPLDFLSLSPSSFSSPFFLFHFLSLFLSLLFTSPTFFIRFSPFHERISKPRNTKVQWTFSKVSKLLNCTMGWLRLVGSLKL